MNKPDISLEKYWNALSSDERTEIVEKAFKYITHLEKGIKTLQAADQTMQCDYCHSIIPKHKCEVICGECAENNSV